MVDNNKNNNNLYLLVITGIVNLKKRMIQTLNSSKSLTRFLIQHIN